MSDAVNSPSHYTQGKIEVIEAIEAWDLGFHLGNAVKYIARAGKKDPLKVVEDLEKARWNILRKIECLKAQAENREACRPKDMQRGPGPVVIISPDPSLRPDEMAWSKKAPFSL